MSAKRLIWTNKKYPKRTYAGSYERDEHGERFFRLSCREKTHRIAFESPQAARREGWVGE